MRRLIVLLAAVFTAGILASGSAVAAPADGPDQLTPREQAGLEFAGDVLGSLFGGGQG
ncbi:hypothetical protein [Streptomyces niger]|uniref:hypothetical protein n=1 Tax=Streptomyces niger TaxID=66373 RepID=UPI000A9B1797|nr:hypothetical protein [Streptomyces niger]